VERACALRYRRAVARTSPALVGIVDHGGYAVAVTTNVVGEPIDRRRLELLEEGLPPLPHHHEGQRLPLPEAVALVAKVRASAERTARTRLAELERDVGVPIVGVALRESPELPPTVEERIRDYRAMCVADWVMYREIVAAAAMERGWRVHLFDAKTILDEGCSALGGCALLEGKLAAARAHFGAPWQRDHRVAMAAAMVALGRG